MTSADAPIGRDALERIIQRAAELQAGEREIGEGLSQGEVLALGREVGIPDRYLRQALLEERTRSLAPAPAGLLTWLGGARELGAHRVVPGNQATVERALARWMENEELLQVRRRYADRTTWEPKAGAFASIQRALGVRGKRYALAGADEVRGSVAELETGFCHIRLAAPVERSRTRRLGQAAALTAIGALGTGLLFTAGVVALLVPLPALVLSFVAVAMARRHRRENGHIQLGLEQVLDRLERGEIRPEHALPAGRGSAFVRVADEIRRTLQP